MKAFRLCALSGVVLTLALNMVASNHEIASASDARLVRIWSVGGDKPVGFHIDPPVLRVDKNTIVRVALFDAAEVSEIQFDCRCSAGVSWNSCCGGWRKRMATTDSCFGSRLPVRR